MESGLPAMLRLAAADWMAPYQYRRQGLGGAR